MLVLTRKKGQKVYLDVDKNTRIEVMITEIERGQVRVGITAPETIKIMRGELWEKS